MARGCSWQQQRRPLGRPLDALYWPLFGSGTVASWYPVLLSLVLLFLASVLPLLQQSLASGVITEPRLVVARAATHLWLPRRVLAASYWYHCCCWFYWWCCCHCHLRWSCPCDWWRRHEAKVVAGGIPTQEPVAACLAAMARISVRPSTADLGMALE